MNSSDNIAFNAEIRKAPPLLGFVLLPALVAFVVSAQAASSTWQGDSGNGWNSDQNWSAGVPGPGDTAIFSTVAAGNSTAPVINFFFLTEVGTILFQNNAPPFQIQQLVHFGQLSRKKLSPMAGFGRDFRFRRQKGISARDTEAA